MAAFAVRAHPGIDQGAGRGVSPALGAGPTIVSKNSEVHYSRGLSDQHHDRAAAHGIPSQPVLFQGFAGDAEAFIRRAIDTGPVAFPMRSTHSPFEMVEERDSNQCVALLAGFKASAPCQGRRYPRNARPVKEPLIRVFAEPLALLIAARARMQQSKERQR